MSETGAVKFDCEKISDAPVEFGRLGELNGCRQKLLSLGLIGVGADGLGFGNVSVRDSKGSAFYVTGSGTSALPALGPEHLARVVAYDFDRNWLRSEGTAIPSAESLTHAAVYEADAKVSAVIHCHSAALWKKLRSVAPSTPADVEYGTPAMARAVMRLFEVGEMKSCSLLVMAGHPEGIVAVGRNLEEAAAILFRHHPASS